MLYKSTDQDEIFMLVRATLERLQREADRIDFKLRLDKEQLRSVCTDPQQHFCRFLPPMAAASDASDPKVGRHARRRPTRPLLTLTDRLTPLALPAEPGAR